MVFWIAAGLAAFFLGLSKGGLPVIALLAVPIMALFMDPAMAAGLLLPLYIVADVYAVYLFRRAYSVRNLKILIPSALIGVIVGYFSVSHVPGDAVKLLLAGIGIFYLATSMARRLSQTERPPAPADVPRGIFWGACAGLTSYIAHAGGPPYQVYVLPQKLDKMTFLGTTTILFTSINLMKVPPYILAEQITFSSMGQSVWLAPMAIFGAWSGSRVVRLLPEKLFYYLIEATLGLVSLKLLYEVIFS
ncbi:MAG: sulfite exporter TauE/SafE family protein [Pseudoruegeria sp.]